METRKQMKLLWNLVRQGKINYCIMDHPSFNYTPVAGRTVQIHSIKLVPKGFSLLLVNGQKVRVTEDNVDEMLTTRLF